MLCIYRLTGKTRFETPCVPKFNAQYGEYKIFIDVDKNDVAASRDVCSNASAKMSILCKGISHIESNNTSHMSRLAPCQHRYIQKTLHFSIVLVIWHSH